jgi:hypothetical protein
MHVQFNACFPHSTINFAISNFLYFLAKLFQVPSILQVLFSVTKQVTKFISFSLAKSINLVCSLIREISEVVSSMRGNEISLIRLIKIFATVLLLWRVDLIHWGFLDAF